MVREALHIVNVGYDSANYYVIGQARNRLLVDTGWPGTLPKLAASLKRKGLRLDEIGCLLVTHYHPDHAGLAGELQAAGLRKRCSNEWNVYLSSPGAGGPK